MSNILLIKNGIIISDNQRINSDILVKDGRIAKISNITEDQGIRVIDASGNFVFPGGIDPHVHMQLPTPAGPSSDDFYTGSLAALSGGTTSFIDFVTPAKGESLVDAYKKRILDAEKSLTDFALHMSPTYWSESVANEIEICIKEYGITSFKTYLAYKDTVGIHDSELLNIMETVAKFGGLVTVHCENGDLIDYLKKKNISEGKTSPVFHSKSRPGLAESQTVQKVVDYSEITGCAVYIVHVSSAESVDIIEKAQKKGIKVFAETCPHYLLLDEELYSGNFEQTAKYIISPPLRTKSDQDRLWQGIKDGVIEAIGTDHCPFNLNGQKDIGRNDFTKIPNGAGSIEYRMALLFTYGVMEGFINVQEFVNITSTNIAKIFNLDHCKGYIKEGYDADIVIWNPDKEFSISKQNQVQNCDSNIFDGFDLEGWPDYVIKSGNIVFEKGNCINKNTKGSYLKRKL